MGKTSSPIRLRRPASGIVELALVAALALVGARCAGGDSGSPPPGDGGTGTDAPRPDGPAGCTPGPFPQAPPGFAPALHVDPRCGAADDADGSPERPYATIAAALAAAPEGAAVLVAPGDFDETIDVTHAVIAIVGRAETPTAVPQTVLRPTQQRSAVMTLGPGGSPPERVWLEGLRIVAPYEAGVVVRGGTVVLRGVHVEGARRVRVAAGDGTYEDRYGHGVVASAGAAVEIRDCAVRDAAGVGVLLDDATGSVSGCTVERNAAGGVRLQRCVGAPVRIEDNTLRANGETGIAVLGSRAEVRGNTVAATTAGAAGAYGDGILVAALPGMAGGAAIESAAAVEDNTVDGGARVGVLIAGGARATVERNTVTANGRAGIWLQTGDAAGAELRVVANTVEANVLVGIALTGGARALVEDNDVGGTLAGWTFTGPGAEEVAYGIGVFGRAFATVSGNRLTPLGAAGTATGPHILVDDALPGTAVRGNRTMGSPEQPPAALFVAVQNQAVGAVTLAGNGADAREELHGVGERPYALMPEAERGFTRGD
jgi:hypothetical protein